MLRVRALMAASRTFFEVNKVEKTADCPRSWLAEPFSHIAEEQFRIP